MRVMVAASAPIQSVPPKGSTHVHCDNCGPGFADYAGAIGGLGSLVLAVVATVIAVRSRADAKRSADSAAESLEIQRREHAAFMEERQRVPRLSIVLTSKLLETTSGPFIAVVQIGIANEGLAAADKALINFMFPAGLRAEKSDQDGNKMMEGGVQVLSADDVLEENGEERPVRYVPEEIDVGPIRAVVRFLRLVFDGPGRYPIRLKLVHPSLSDGVLNTYHVITVEEWTGRSLATFRTSGRETPTGRGLGTRRGLRGRGTPYARRAPARQTPFPTNHTQSATDYRSSRGGFSRPLVRTK